VLARLPETKRIFTRSDGEWYTAGDRFTQPALAATLRRVEAEGADHMYAGA
jgi:gamma-glutamyltranspeptidase/glutathione hydrolase